MNLEPTGERLLVDAYQASAERYLIYLFHIAAYRFASQHIRDKRVLDYGCGSGYGTHMLAPMARSILGVDVAEEAVEHARKTYSAENLLFQKVNPDEELPFEDASFDVVLSFQVFEHVTDTRRYLEQTRRVLAPGGKLILVTPDRRTRLLPLQRPWNRFHVREYAPAEIKTLLGDCFETVTMAGMSGNPEVLAIELKRCQKIKWLTLPFTLPLWPDRMRVALLDLIYRVRGNADRATSVPISFDETSIRIEADAWPSVNIVAVAQRGAR